MSDQRRSSLLLRSFRKQYPSAVRGEGAWIFDAEGRKYFDFSGSAAVNFIGHGDAAVRAAIAKQLAALEFVHSSQFTTPIAEQFAGEILEFAGPAFAGGAVFFTCGGSEAVESALKLARQYQVEIGERQRTQVLCRKQAYHGATLGAMTVSGNLRRREIYLPMMMAQPRVNTPYCYRCAYGCDRCADRYAAEVEQAIDSSARELMAFIFEPVSGATIGAALPPDGYLKRVNELCQARGVLTIADEVMTGFGRTGRNFAVDRWEVAPDMLVAAKGIASGYAPLGAVIANRRVVDAIAGGSGALVHGLTYNAQPVSLAAGAAVLARIRNQSLVEVADEIKGSVGNHVKAKLESLAQLDSVGDVRGVGLLWAIEFVQDKGSKRPYDVRTDFAAQAARAAAKRGVMTYPMQGCIDGASGDHILLAPPATSTTEDISWAVDQLQAAIEEVECAVGKANG